MIVFEQMNTAKAYQIENSEEDMIRLFQELVDKGKKNLILIESYYMDTNFNYWIRLANEYSINLLIGQIYTFKTQNGDFTNLLFLSRDEEEHQVLRKISILTSKPFGYRFETISQEELSYFIRLGFPMYSIRDGYLYDYMKDEKWSIENGSFDNTISFSSLISFYKKYEGKLSPSNLQLEKPQLESWVDNLNMASNWKTNTINRDKQFDLSSLINWEQFNYEEKERLKKEIKWLETENYDVIFWLLSQNKRRNLVRAANSFRYFLLSYALGIINEKSYVKLIPLNSNKILQKGFCLVTTNKSKPFFLLESKNLLSNYKLDIKHPIVKDSPLFETLCRGIAQELFPDELANGMVSINRLIEQKDDYDDFTNDKEEFFLLNQIYFALYPEEELVFSLATTIQEKLLFKKVVAWDKSIIHSDFDFYSKGEISTVNLDQVNKFKIPLIHWKIENQKTLNHLN